MSEDDLLKKISEIGHETVLEVRVAKLTEALRNVLGRMWFVKQMEFPESDTKEEFIRAKMALLLGEAKS